MSLPHLHRPHLGEYRWPVSAVVLTVITIQFLIPTQFSFELKKTAAVVQFLLLIALVSSNPIRISKHQLSTRYLGIAVTSTMTILNSISVIKLIDALIFGHIKSAPELLAVGGSIWFCNIVIFSLWYWDLDRGGPGARAEAKKEFPDFLFPQMSDPKYAPDNWNPHFFDYLYTSFTNASAFSPTDAMPLTRWAKGLMFLQSLTSLVVVGLVIARAVNILA